MYGATRGGALVVLTPRFIDDTEPVTVAQLSLLPTTEARVQALVAWSPSAPRTAPANVDDSGC